MLIVHRIGVAVAFVLLSIWLLIGSLFAPPSGQIRHNQPATEDKDDQRETFWQRTFNDPTAFFTLCVAAFTGVLGFSTIGLWFVNRTAANAALRQANVMIAVESPIPLIVGFNIVQFSQIPGETVVADPYGDRYSQIAAFFFASKIRVAPHYLCSNSALKNLQGPHCRRSLFTAMPSHGG
jgi:hypothetical protein